MWLSGTRLCDRCFDDRVATHMGLPRLPDPPSPLVLTGPDGRRHRLRFRIWRAPTGIEVELEETDVADGEGYAFALLGDHDADVDELVARVGSLAEREVGHVYLEAASRGPGWVVRDDEVAGRLIWNDEAHAGSPYHVVVDGRTLSWEELGLALSGLEGCSFRLVIDDRVADTRSGADVIELGRSEFPPGRPDD